MYSVQESELMNKDEINHILELIEDYGRFSMEIGFYDKGTKEYSESFAKMTYAFGDILCLLNGKEPLPREATFP